jgi:hypothetical protein
VGVWGGGGVGSREEGDGGPAIVINRFMYTPPPPTKVLENFDDPSALGRPGSIFNRGFLALSLQTTGSLYYSYLNGVAAVARSYMERSDGFGTSMPELPAKTDTNEQDAVHDNRIDSFNFGGQWGGSIEHNTVQLSTPVMKDWGLGLDAANSVHQIGFALPDYCEQSAFCGKVTPPLPPPPPSPPSLLQTAGTPKPGRSVFSPFPSNPVLGTSAVHHGDVPRVDGARPCN